MEIIAHYGMIFVALSIILGLHVTWSVGAHGAVHIMGIVTDSNPVRIRTSRVIVVISGLLGAVLVGGPVTATLQHQLLFSQAFTDRPEWLVYSMLATLLATSIWMVLAAAKGWPVVATQAVVGAMAGVALLTMGRHAIQWYVIGSILMAWVLFPLLAGLLAWLLMRTVFWLVLDHPQPCLQARRIIPFFLFGVAVWITETGLQYGLHHFHIDLAGWLWPSALLVGWLVARASRVLLTGVETAAQVDTLFAVVMPFAGAAMAFAYGSNEVANGVAPMTAVITAVATEQRSIGPLLIGAVGMMAGLAAYGYHVMTATGAQRHVLASARGFCAILAAAVTVLTATRMGLPVPTGYIVTVAVMGSMKASGTASLDFRVIGAIVTSWIVTWPVTAVLATLLFLLFKGLFS
ncbi:MAG: inorganic phosphate transporter [Magnetococcales bacterium]|nr:inorganic phosphate transporter [Magnetococcales bacterium]